MVPCLGAVPCSWVRLSPSNLLAWSRTNSHSRRCGDRSFREKLLRGGGSLRVVVISNIFYVHPENWGRWTQFDEHIFQRGWNHQLVLKQLTTSQENPQKPNPPIHGNGTYLPTWMVNLYGKCRSIYHSSKMYPEWTPKCPWNSCKVFKLYHPLIYENIPLYL